MQLTWETPLRRSWEGRLFDSLFDSWIKCAEKTTGRLNWNYKEADKEEIYLALSHKPQEEDFLSLTCSRRSSQVGVRSTVVVKFHIRALRHFLWKMFQAQNQSAVWLWDFLLSLVARVQQHWGESRGWNMDRKMWNQIPGNVESHNWNSAYAQRHKTCMNNILFYSDWSLPVTPTVSCQWTSAESMLVLAPHWDSNIKGETAERKMNTLTACTHSTQFITQYFLLNSRKVINDFVYKAHMKNKEFHNTE